MGHDTQSPPCTYNNNYIYIYIYISIYGCKYPCMYTCEYIYIYIYIYIYTSTRLGMNVGIHIFQDAQRHINSFGRQERVRCWVGTSPKVDVLWRCRSGEFFWYFRENVTESIRRRLFVPLRESLFSVYIYIYIDRCIYIHIQLAQKISFHSCSKSQYMGFSSLCALQ